MHPDFARLSSTLKQRPLVLGVLNVTPDSFSDGGRYLAPEAALAQARRLLADGADLVDLGGESTRPGAPAGGPGGGIDRVIPVMPRRLRWPLPGLALSIDTFKAGVAQACLAEGACLLNDVSALMADPAMLGVAAASRAGISLMHRLQAPAAAKWSTQEKQPLRGGGRDGGGARVPEATGSTPAVDAGIDSAQGLVRPGARLWQICGRIMFVCLKELPSLVADLGCPLLVGPSRKSFVGAVLDGLPVEERLEGTLAACSAAVLNGASVLRVHDVKEAVRASRLAWAGQVYRAFPAQVVVGTFGWWFRAQTLPVVQWPARKGQHPGPRANVRQTA